MRQNIIIFVNIQTVICESFFCALFLDSWEFQYF